MTKRHVSPYARSRVTSAPTNVQYDSDLIQNDIIEEDFGDIAEHLLSLNGELDKDDLVSTLRAILDEADEKELETASPPLADAPEPSPNNAEPATVESSIDDSPFALYLCDLRQLEYAQHLADIEETLRTQCPLLIAAAADEQQVQDVSFLMMLSLTTQTSLSSWITDSFDRLRLDFLSASSDPLYVGAKCPQFGAYLDALEDLNQIDFNIRVPRAMSTYQRISSCCSSDVERNAQPKIRDSLEDIASHVLGAVLGVDEARGSQSPFQLDVCIIPRGASDSHRGRDASQSVVERTSRNIAVRHAKHKRFVLMIDRSEGDCETYGLTQDDSAVFDVDTAGYLDELYFENTRRSKLLEHHKDSICLSFHVLSRDTMRMYAYVRGSRNRFQMSDLWTVFPLYFENASSTQSIRDMVHAASVGCKLQDNMFHQFYQRMTRGMQRQESPEHKSEDDRDDVKAEDKEETASLHGMGELIEWLSQQALAKQYPQHHATFCDTVRALFDETDFDIGCVTEELSLDIADSEILGAMKEDEQCSTHFDPYILSLRRCLRLYTRDQNPDAHRHHGPAHPATCRTYLTYYCRGECGNACGRYLFDDTLSAQSKAQTLCMYFWSVDYAARQWLIELLSAHSHPVREDADADQRERLLSILSDASVWIDTDEKWTQEFEAVLEADVELKIRLSQKTCLKHVP